MIVTDEEPAVTICISGPYSYDVLTAPPEFVPDDVNRNKMETYLDDAEFEEVFGMERADFYKLPKWKIEVLKKDKKLF